MKRSIAMAAGLSLALGTASLAGADDQHVMDERGAVYGGEPAYDKDPRQLMPSENPLKGMPGKPRAGTARESYAEPPEYGKDPRQLMPTENPHKGFPRAKHDQQ